MRSQKNGGNDLLKSVLCGGVGEGGAALRHEKGTRTSQEMNDGLRGDHGLGLSRVNSVSPCPLLCQCLADPAVGEPLSEPCGEPWDTGGRGGSGKQLSDGKWEWGWAVRDPASATS